MSIHSETQNYIQNNINIFLVFIFFDFCLTFCCCCYIKYTQFGSSKNVSARKWLPILFLRSVSKNDINTNIKRLRSSYILFEITTSWTRALMCRSLQKFNRLNTKVDIQLNHRPVTMKFGITFQSEN